jgi:hypothetical protein
VSDSAIGWFFFLSSFACRRLPCSDSSAYTSPSCLVTFQVTLVSSRTLNRLNHDFPRSVRIYYRRPFTFQRPVPHTGSSNHQPQAPLSCFDKTDNHTPSFLPPHTQLLSVSSTCLKKIPGSWIRSLDDSCILPPFVVDPIALTNKRRCSRACSPFSGNRTPPTRHSFLTPNLSHSLPDTTDRTPHSLYTA